MLREGTTEPFRMSSHREGSLHTYEKKRSEIMSGKEDGSHCKERRTVDEEINKLVSVDLTVVIGGNIHQQ
jgi:hypothetical protein